MTPADQIKVAREESQRRSQKWEEEHRRRMAEAEALDAIIERDVLPHLRPATASDYNRWIVGYLENGGKVTHAYDYPLPRSWYVAIRDFNLPPLYGSQSLQIIIPSGLTVVCHEPGHSRVYWMDGFKAGIDGQHSMCIVPVFSDTRG